MWANRDWVGTVFPTDTPVGGELAAYARVCNAVEGNTTFYALPAPSTVEKWRKVTPAGFRFMLKLPRTITHDRRLRDVQAELSEFTSRFAPLRDRLGPCSVQLPSSFGPEDLGVLVGFLESVPSDLDWAVEVRHAAFHAGGDHERVLNDELHRLGVDRVIFDSRPVFAGPRRTPEEIEAWENKPRLAVRAVATAGQPVVRFIGQTDPAANPGFWGPWVRRVTRWIEDGRRPLVFLHTPDNIASPRLCQQFYDEVAEPARLTPRPPAPEVAAPVALFDPQ
jgi:uncharacterized protein YecE (DUF72 family)